MSVRSARSPDASAEPADTHTSASIRPQHLWCFSVFLHPAHLESIKDEGLVVWAQLQVRQTPGSRPTHPHLSRRHHLQLKVPLPSVHAVRLLRSEYPEALGGQITHVCSSCCTKHTRVSKPRLDDDNTLVCSQTTTNALRTYTILPKVLAPLLMNRFDYFSNFYEYKS